MFPTSIKKEVLDVIKNIELNYKYSFEMPDDCFEVTVNNEQIKIPYRIYFDFPSENEINKLIGKQTQIEILFCIFSRHNDGFIREKCLKEIVASKNTWTTPYVIELLGEYVVEIIYEIKKRLNDINIEYYREYIMINYLYFEKICQRAISYWDCYYRLIYKYRRDYPVFQVIEYIDNSREIFKLKFEKRGKPI